MEKSDSLCGESFPVHACHGANSLSRRTQFPTRTNILGWRGSDASGPVARSTIHREQSRAQSCRLPQYGGILGILGILPLYESKEAMSVPNHTPLRTSVFPVLALHMCVDPSYYLGACSFEHYELEIEHVYSVSIPYDCNSRLFCTLVAYTYMYVSM
jgi:hypothetical protein